MCWRAGNVACLLAAGQRGFGKTRTDALHLSDARTLATHTRDYAAACVAMMFIFIDLPARTNPGAFRARFVCLRLVALLTLASILYFEF